ncbi:MAG: Zn-ribbon domain-containing OB-fold protein [Candidatus Helarchaeota archaeon]
MQPPRIVWNKCKKCGKLQYPDHLRCLQCKNTTFDTIEAAGDCRLLTYTILRAPPAEFWKAATKNPMYALGIVEFSNGIRALGQLTTTENLKIGLKLKPVVKKLTDNLDGQEVIAIGYEPI